MMNSEEIKEKVLQYKWEFWIDRPFGAFVLSPFKGASRKYNQKLGIDAEMPAQLFQGGAWYRSEEVWDQFEMELQRHLDAGGNVFDIVKRCEEYRDVGMKKIEELKISPIDPISKLKELIEVFAPTITHIWLAHGFEHLYSKKLHLEVPKYMTGDVEKNIGDISFPLKKNAHNYFEEALNGDVPLEEVHANFAWIKARGGFADGFTLEEMKAERERLSITAPSHRFERPEIPAPLKELASIAQELVYYRTLRTDVLYELMYSSRSILSEIANHFGLTFKELRDYAADDLIANKPRRYTYGNVSMVSYKEHFVIVEGRIFEAKSHEAHAELKGAVAYKGKATGIAKIVMTADEIGKVNAGDILIAPTTAPSYIAGMQRAAAFVTDEGGITSHAAIVAREMKKPCVIGTKMATKILKDGQTVEVDAEKGIVRVL